MIFCREHLRPEFSGPRITDNIGNKRIIGTLNNNPINALTVSGTDIYAVFFQGVYHGIANDLSWTMINSGLSNYVECLLVKDSCLFAGTYFNGIFILKTMVKTGWRAITGFFPGSSLPCVKTLATDGTTIYAGTRGKGIFVSMDGGETWTAQNTGLVDNYVSCIAIHGDTVIAVADKGIYLSMHNGIWTDITPAPKPSKSAGFYSIAANASAIYIGMDSCRIAKSVDNGSTWNVSRIPIPFSQAVINSLLIKNDSLYAGTSCGLYVSAVNPQAWVNYDSGLNAASIPSLIVRDSGLFASEFAKVCISKDNGSTWNTATAGQPDNPITYMLECDSVLLAITANGLYLSDKTGYFWKKINSNLPPSNCGNFTMSAGDFYAWNADSIYQSTDTGAHWVLFASPPYSTNQIVAHNKKLFAATNFDGLFLYDSKLLKWTNIYKSKESTTDIYSLFCHENNIYICANANLFSSSNTGSTWSALYTQLGHPMVASWAISNNCFLLGTMNLSDAYFFFQWRIRLFGNKIRSADERSFRSNEQKLRLCGNRWSGGLEMAATQYFLNNK